jgi:hypothetical protein
MEWLQEYDELVKTDKLEDSQALINLINKRINWMCHSEYGFKSHIGRTLERSGASVMYVNSFEDVLDELLVKLQNNSESLRTISKEQLEKFLFGFLLHIKNIGAIFSGYLGLALMGATFTAIGVYTSSVTENQVVAFIIGVFVVLVFYMLDKMLIFVPHSLAGLVQFLAVDYHLSNISRGVIDSRNLVYFFSMIGFFIFLTIQTLEVRRWK